MSAGDPIKATNVGVGGHSDNNVGREYSFSLYGEVSLHALHPV